MIEYQHSKNEERDPNYCEAVTEEVVLEHNSVLLKRCPSWPKILTSMALTWYAQQVKDEEKWWLRGNSDLEEEDEDKENDEGEQMDVDPEHNEVEENTQGVSIDISSLYC